MIFEREKYYKLICTLEKSVTAIYAIIMFFSVIIGLAAGVAGVIVTIPVGLLISYFTTFATKVKIQEMKWKFDIYEKLK